MRDAPGLDYRRHSLRPVVLDAAQAHRERWLSYAADGSATLALPDHAEHGLPSAISIGPDAQFPAIRATFEDLQRPLLGAPRSPSLEGGSTLSELYEAEARKYAALTAAAHARGALEPDYGSYVFDRLSRNLYLIAPEPWHRLALVASNSKLLTDPEGKLGWGELRRKLEGAVIGFAGASVGGNLLEGWLRDARPKCVKLADPDRVELTNFNRAERVSLRHLVQSRGQQAARPGSQPLPRVSKAEYLAYEQQLVDPYLDVFVYAQGLTRDNLSRFLLGDGGSEPAIDILVEEMDDIALKLEARQAARAQRIDVLMLSDFGNMAHAVWNPFREEPDAPLAQSGDDAALLAALERYRAGEPRKLLELVTHLCGSEFWAGSFGRFVRGEDEQLISGVPQLGATAMAAGAIGGKELALRVLGHPLPAKRRVVYDLCTREARQG